ncbi:insulinase family protein [Clostridium senegalense]|uniref:Insulinase family protein n=1 Tax=Clostridium senegalense TaxID=1465809 RepID=A0A6M0H2F0_9CLOT|nr:insulinase family protein [Clostridium senegalense]NEU04344.1 insulinase family protein [Clostridium senegalense]
MNNGFKLLKEVEVKEINSLAKVFEHEKTKAKLLYLGNDDTNRVFTIGFRTPPEDNTGVAHIIEHSVLCGSRKFPTKEPFVELIKGSLNTFLNAMTFADKTIYPLASKNEKDFMNLMDVYLDAVFYPNIYANPEILMQEGWHYELENKEDDLNYKGVVYNEMKGAFSSPDGVLMRKIQETLFEDTTYGVESGGDPEFIPDLTQEGFLNFHSRYYHPSNSYIFLYGDLDIDKYLNFIDKEYLSNFEYKQIDSEIKQQKPLGDRKYVVDDYPISEEDSEKEKTFMALNFVTGKGYDEEVHLALDTLEYLLLETQGAPLKKALIDNNIGKDVYGSLDTSILQPVFSIIVKNSEEGKKEEFEKVVDETLRNLVKNGIDKKLIEACINITEFRLREADFQGFPKGLFYYISLMDSWLYGKDPLIHLQYDGMIEKMKEGLSTNYFESLIEKYLLNNNHTSLLVLKPKKGLAEERDKKVKEKLKAYKESLSNEQLEEIIEETKTLILRQNTPDSKEALETIPLLSLDDIDKNVEDLSVKEECEKDIKILWHETFTSKIAYINVFFDSTSVLKEDICYLSLLTSLIGKLDTDKKSYVDLSNEVLINTGGIYFRSEVFGDSLDANKYYPYVVGYSKAILDKVPNQLELLSEMYNYTNFKNIKRIKEVVQQLKSRIEMSIIERGHQVAALRLNSYYSPASKYIENVSGLEFYKFIQHLEENFDSEINNVVAKLEDIKNKVFNKENLMVSITGEKEELEKLKANISILTDNINNNKYEKQVYDFKVEQKNEGLLTPSNVQYVAKGYNFKDLGYEYSGKLLVLKTIMKLDYLWNKIRVQGGAYGAMTSLVRSGNMVFVSYRDPNLAETLKAYDEIVKYIESFSTSEREMTKYIIGTISELDSPLTPSMKGEKAVSMYIRHITLEDLRKEREEILNATEEDMRKHADLVKAVVSKDFYTILGNDKKIKENKNIFNNLVTVF